MQQLRLQLLELHCIVKSKHAMTQSCSTTSKPSLPLWHHLLGMPMRILENLHLGSSCPLSALQDTGPTQRQSALLSHMLQGPQSRLCQPQSILLQPLDRRLSQRAQACNCPWPQNRQLCLGRMLQKHKSSLKQPLDQLQAWVRQSKGM